MWAQNNLWACVGIFVSGLMKLRPENLYLSKHLYILLGFCWDYSKLYPKIIVWCKVLFRVN